MSILTKKAGILTTVQDLGRNGFRKFGVNPNGAMDKIAVRLINSLLTNDENEAVLEIHFPAGEFIFEESAIFALGGADFAANLNGDQLEKWRVYFAEKGSILCFAKKIFGNRAYFSIKGGFKIERWLDSASTNMKAKIGGFEGDKLKNGDRIYFNQTNSRHSFKTNYKISHSLIPFYSTFPTVRIVEGAEFDLLTAISQENFLKENFQVTQHSDRMGFRLNGTQLYMLYQKELVSSAVNFGTIQLLPDGQMIVLMADHQTTGGYPRIANVISSDLPLIAQLGANDKIAFHLISLSDAEKIQVQFERDLKILSTACKFRQ